MEEEDSGSSVDDVLIDSQCEEASEGCFQDESFMGLKTLLQNMPLGMEIDWCPNESARQRKINALVNDIEFVNQNEVGHDSDSDVSLNMEELANPRLVQRAMSRPQYSVRRPELEKLIQMKNNEHDAAVQKGSSLQEKVQICFNVVRGTEVPQPHQCASLDTSNADLIKINEALVSDYNWIRDKLITKECELQRAREDSELRKAELTNLQDLHDNLQRENSELKSQINCRAKSRGRKRRRVI